MTGQNRVAIPSLDPRFVKGVRSVIDIAYDAAAAAGLDPRLVYNAIPWRECLTIRDLLRGHWDVTVDYRVTDGLEGTGIGRVFPEFEIFNYLLNNAHWQTELAGVDATLVVGGPCIAGLPAARADNEFAVWLGTMVEDEREAQKSGYGGLERLRYELTRPILQRYERYVLHNADKVYAQSKYTRSRAVKQHNLPPEKIDVLPCAVDTERYHPDPDATNPHEIIFVGRLNDPRKNIQLLLDAFEQVVADVPGAQLTLVGAQPDKTHQAHMQNLGIASNVVTPGEVESVVPYLQRAAVFAYPSRQEGFGIAALEALSCGTPVVTTDCGGPTDFVIEDETGFVVDQDDTDAFGDRLVTLLEDETRRRRHGDRGRSLTEREFSRNHIAGRLQSILNDLVE